MAEVEETLKRIQSHKGVIGTMVVNAEGIPIRTTLDNSTTVQYAGLLHHLTMKAKSTVRDIDPQNDLTFLRIRSKKHEIMVAPETPVLPAPPFPTSPSDWAQTQSAMTGNEAAEQVFNTGSTTFNLSFPVYKCEECPPTAALNSELYRTA
ncbi:dynein light chain roadblock-type 2 isoform X2 [Piliocolobus tephrosceles]|uniref:dynein light chain roadblock-type 2 isoform X2 n=1 Tax=Piliocolobus tephrosceles TaxID=591936 RepID=UPI000E6B3515|nr:dynein light chain roadblock-type 2 isoform X2 [Piliocolobus tephrosceles]